MGMGELPSRRVVPLFCQQEKAARLLGMSLQDFLERKALLLRQVEEVQKALKEGRKAVERVKEALRAAAEEGGKMNA